MRTGELAKWLGVTHNAIRQWAGEWREYVSQTAAGGDGRTRNFSDQDARIIALIYTLKTEGVPRLEIHQTLRQLQTEGWQDLPPMPPAPPDLGPIPMIPREAAETAVATQRQALMREIAILHDQVKSLEERLTTETERYTQERQTLQAELLGAKERLGELRGQLTTVEAQRQGEQRLFVSALVAVTIVAGVLLVAVVLLALASGGGG